MLIEDDEDSLINKLITCSDRENKREKQVWVGSWDEVRGWKAVSPMGVYKKPKKKIPKLKKTMALLNKTGNNMISFSHRPNPFPYRYRFPETGKAAHSSTNVLSYNSPSWRFIVDWKTFSYVGRNGPGDRIMNRYRNSAGGSRSDLPSFLIDSDYDGKISINTVRFNPSDVIDDRIENAYKESLKFDIQNYDTEQLRQMLFTKLPVASVEDLESEKNDNGDEDKNPSVGKGRFSLCIRTNTKVAKETKKLKVKMKKKKKGLKKNQQAVPVKTIELPPIDSHHRSNCTDFPSYTEQAKVAMLTNNEESTSDSGQYLYLPTLQYGNYEHLFKDKYKREGEEWVKFPKVYI